MLLLCIRSYLKSILGYGILILDTYHPDTYLLEQRCQDPWLYFEEKRGPRVKTLGNPDLDALEREKYMTLPGLKPRLQG